jgi:hypothetical protein
MVSKLVGASVWEEELHEHLTSHVSNEREILLEYQEAAAASGSAAFQYLASLIVEDEIRHHRIFEDLASALRTDAELRPEQPAIPRLDHWGPDPGHVVELTERLMEREREDAKALGRLGREMKDVRDTTMWGLLVKLMEMDTDKHLEILEFVRRHARKSSAG